MSISPKYTLVAALGGCVISSLALAAPSPAPSPDPAAAFPPQPPVKVLSPEEEAKTFQLPPGYKMELVLDDQSIKEPVLCVFDGDGRMYVAEMRTYMQDIDGSNELVAGGLVSRHESSNKNGVFDKHSVVADKLLLPRMVLPLQKDKLIIGETNTTDLYTFSDTTGKGVLDKKDLFYKGETLSSNLEHQPSGLLWDLDNWIYTTVNGFRLRFNPNGGLALKESIPGNGGQWGLAQDNNGKLWWSNAGGEKGIYHFQTPIEYGAIDLPEQFDPDFLAVWPLVGLADVQGGIPRFRPENKTLNHFTASCGQEIFRGDRLPQDFQGNALVAEPVGRLIRRATVEEKDGITYLKNPYQEQKSEFLRSTDPNFRPVNMTTGPDGCLYIVDMYRGIIQEGEWTRQGSYLRKVITQYNMQAVTNHGRIWRLVHKDYQPGPQPHMYEETPAQLVAHLNHPNGWWRDTAQKLIVLSQDKSVVPALANMARTDTNPLGRLHALWTLEGLGSADAALVRDAMKDKSPQIRIAAIRVSESLIKAGDDSLKTDVQAMVKDPDSSVVLQSLMTSKAMNWPNWHDQLALTINSSPSHGVKEIVKQLLVVTKSFNSRLFAGPEIALLKKGEETFGGMCFACHGFDGKGMPVDVKGESKTIAPPLAGSPTVVGSPSRFINVVLHGLAGPAANGKTYDAQMIPMGANSDEWVAAVTSYLRKSFGNDSDLITPAMVAAVRAETKDRIQPWTHAELDPLGPQPIADSSNWKATASINPEKAQLAVDGKPGTRYAASAMQTAGEWFQLELPQPTAFCGLRMWGGFPKGYKVETSQDGLTWDKPVAQGKGQSALMEIAFPTVNAKFVRITETAKGGKRDPAWSIAELQLLQLPAKK